MLKLLSSVALGTVLTFTALPAQAQVLPGTIDPGRIQQRYEVESRPAVSGDSVIQVEDRKGAKRLSGGTSFLLEGVSIENNTAIDDAALAHLYEDKVGEKITLTGLQELTDSITAHYRNEGYILSRAVLPPQRIGDGVVKIRILEGKLGSVTLTGDVSDDSLAHDYAEKLRGAGALNVKDLERYLLLMDDLSGATARATLSAADSEVGASDRQVSIMQKDMSARVGINNRGSRYLGPAQADLSAQGHNLLGLHETIGVRTIQTLNLDELHYYEASYSQPVGADGTVIRGLISYTDTEPGNGLAPLQLEGKSTTARLDVSHPFIRSRRENLFGSVAFTYRNVDSETFGLSTFEDRIRTLSGQLAYDFYDRFQGINQLSGSITQGIGVLGANDAGDLISRANADDTFTRFNADMQRLQPIGGHFAIQLAASGQYSSDPLYASEEFSVGSTPFGSAYDPSELSGDRGIALRSELHYNGDYTTSWLNHYQFYSFWDIGKVWNETPVAGEDDGESLASAGIGARFGVFDRVRGDVEFAVPLTRNVAAENLEGEEARFFFNLTSSY